MWLVGFAVKVRLARQFLTGDVQTSNGFEGAWDRTDGDDCSHCHECPPWCPISNPNISLDSNQESYTSKRSVMPPTMTIKDPFPSDNEERDLARFY